MKKINIKTWIIIFIIAILSINAFRISGNPNIFPGIYSGLVLSLFGIFLISLISNKYISSVFGGLIILFGIIFRNYYPIMPKSKKIDLTKFIESMEEYNKFLNDYIILFIILGIILGFIFSLISEKYRNRTPYKLTVTKITYMSIFIALSVMINSLRIGSVSFGGFPIIFSGYLLGPISGFIVGALSDLLGFLIRPSAFAFNPLFTLTSALTGALPIIVNKILKENYPNFSFIKILTGIFIGQIITSVILVPIFSTLLYGQNTFWVLATNAFIKQIVSIPIYAFLVYTLNSRLKSIIDFNKELK